MNDNTRDNTQNYGELARILDELKEKGNLVGVLFSYRNGDLIIENIGSNVDIKKFSSMCASVLESAVGLGQTIRDSKIEKIIAEIEEKTIIITECNEKTFLTLIAKKESKVSLILSQIVDYINGISKISN